MSTDFLKIISKKLVAKNIAFFKAQILGSIKPDSHHFPELETHISAKKILRQANL